MLIRHTLIYSVGRGAAGVVNLATLALYTRLLNTEEYGRYALVVAGVGLVSGIVFHWLSLGARRFYAAYDTRRSDFLITLRGAYLRVAVPALLLAVTAVVVWPDPHARRLVALGAVLLNVSAWFDLSLELSLASLKPVRYGVLTLVKALLALVCGGLFAWLGFGAGGVLFGAIIAYAGPALVTTRDLVGAAHGGRSDARIMREFLHYGLPLTGSVALAVVVGSTDRLLLGLLKGPSAVGTYGAAYDLSFQALTALMALVNLSAFPLAVRALEDHGVAGVREQLSRHAILLLALATPATVGMVAVAPNAVSVLLGSAFHETASILLPWLAVTAFLAGVKAFYFDLSFQLGRATMKQVWVGAIAAIVNVGLNILWIPMFGLIGAAWASLAAYVVGLALSVAFARNVIRMPVPAAEWGKIAIAAGVMGLALMPFRSYRGGVALSLQILGGAAVYLMAATVLNVGQSRNRLGRVLRASAR